MDDDMSNKSDTTKFDGFLEKIGGEWLDFELQIVKNGDEQDTWLKYIDAVSEPQYKLAVIRRGIDNFTQLKKFHICRVFWVKYLNLLLELCSPLRYEITSHQDSFRFVNNTFVEFLSHYNDIEVWKQYFGFLNRQSDVKHILNEYVRCFRTIPFEHHEGIWPSLLKFNERIGPYSADISLKVLKRFVSYGKFTIDHLVQLAQLYSKTGLNPGFLRKSLRDGDFSVDDWKSVLTFVHDEDTMELFIEKFPDQYIYGQLRIINNYDGDKKISLYQKELNKCKTVHDFSTIYNAYISYLEGTLTETSSEDDFLRVQKLLDDRKSMINSIYLNSDSQNLNHWFKKFDLYNTKAQLPNLLKSLVSAITTINPLTCYGNHKLCDIWIKYAKIYSDSKDYKTANLIYSKSIKSKFKTKEELVQLYLNWSKMFVDNDKIEDGIRVLESIIFKHEDISSSPKLWLYYFEVLEVNCESQRVLDSYYKMIEMKYATGNILFSMASFLEDEGLSGQMFKLYEHCINVFNDPRIQFEIYNKYLPKLIKHTTNLEYVRDVFDRCLRQVPDTLQSAIIVLYSDFEYNNGLIIKSFNLLNDYILRTKSDPLDLILLVTSKFSGHVDLRDTLQQYVALKLTPKTFITLMKEFINFETSQKQYQRARYLFEYLHKNANYPFDDWEAFELENGDESTFKGYLRFKSSHKQEEPQGFVKGAKSVSVTENPDEIDLDM